MAISSFLPTWVVGSMRSPAALKLFFRCWLASFIAFILLLPNKSLATLGNAGFFVFLVSLIFPPAMQLQPFFFGLFTLVLGQLMGWAFGSAGMRTALAARDQILLKQTLETVQAGAAASADPDAAFQIAIFQGKFLDTRSSIAYGCFLGLGTFVFALIRTYIPKLQLLAMFGTIMIDIFCTYGPLFPFAEYTIVNSLLISTSTYAAIAVVLITVLFPQTMSSAQLASTAGILGKVNQLFDAKEAALAEGDLESLAPGGKTIAALSGLRGDIMSSFQTLSSKSGFINLEFSYGAWNGDDVRDLETPLLTFLTRATSTIAYFTALGSTNSTVTTPAITPTTTNTSGTGSSQTAHAHPTSDSYLFRQLRTRHHAAEEHFQVRPADLVPTVRGMTADLRTASAALLATLEAELTRINNTRWSRKDVGPSAEVETALEDVRRALQEFKDEKRKEMLAPFQPVLEAYRGPGWETRAHPWEGDAHGDHSGTGNVNAHPDGPQRDVPLRALYISAVFASNLIWTAEALVALGEAVVTTATHHHRNRLWAPKGLRAFGKLLTRRDIGEEGVGEDIRPDVPVHPELEEEAKRGRGKKANKGKGKVETYRRDPDSLPPSNPVQMVMNQLHFLYTWLKTPEALFVIKYVVISVLLWLPSAVKRSAYFYYTEKGVWALIMAQTTMNVYVADQMYNFVVRICGTFLGLIVGLLAWYIGAQNTVGTPYGVAASTGVFLIPVLFIRLFAPPRIMIPCLLFSVTFALIMGYSWVDRHLATFGNPGSGWQIAWRRFVLVVIGCVASMVIMVIPPTSSRKAIRMHNAKSLVGIARIYSLLMSTWVNDRQAHAHPETAGSSGKLPENVGERGAEASEKNAAAASSSSASDGEVEEGKPVKALDGAGPRENAAATEEWRNNFRAQLVPLIIQLQALKGQTAIAKWEGHVRGAWPFDLYNKLVDEQTVMMINLSQLAGVLAHLDPERREALLHRTRILNPHFITEVLSVFSHVSASLRTGDPLLTVLPHKLIDRLFYHHTLAIPPNVMREDADTAAEFEESVRRIGSLDTMYFATGIVAVYQLLSSLDTIHHIVVELCGEIPFEGFHEWAEEYDIAHSS